MNKKLQKGLTTVMAVTMGAGMFIPTITVMATATTNGWSFSKGQWYFLSNGNRVVNVWKQDASKQWFYLGSSGAMVTNFWARDSLQRWFYLGADGAMKVNYWNAWTDGKQYYVGNDGGMLVSPATPQGWTIDINGAWDGQSKKADITIASNAVTAVELGKADIILTGNAYTIKELDKLATDKAIATDLVNKLYNGEIKTALITRLTKVVIIVTSEGNTTSIVNGGTLKFKRFKTPYDPNSVLSWSVTPGTGTATINGAGDGSGLLKATGVGTVTVIATDEVYGMTESMVITIK